MPPMKTKVFVQSENARVCQKSLIRAKHISASNMARCFSIGEPDDSVAFLALGFTALSVLTDALNFHTPATSRKLND